MDRNEDCRHTEGGQGAGRRDTEEGKPKVNRPGKTGIPRPGIPKLDRIERRYLGGFTGNERQAMIGSMRKLAAIVAVISKDLEKTVLDAIEIAEGLRL